MSQAQRWETFLAKVAARADEILAEAGPAFDELIATEVLDPTPLSSALTELHSRMLGLERKIDDAWEKIDAELGDEGGRDALIASGRAVRKAIARKSKVMQVQKQARAAHAVWELARAEMEQVKTSTRCTHCGAPMEPTVLHQASNVTCAHCKAVSVLRPGVATLYFFQGICLHALGEEAALDESARLEDAIETYQALRQKRQSDVEAWRDAHRRYWVAYARGYGAHVPDWSEQKARDLVQARLAALSISS
jgi:hypothetical protein